jgi:hypothetical protein
VLLFWLLGVVLGWFCGWCGGGLGGGGVTHGGDGCAGGWWRVCVLLLLWSGCVGLLRVVLGCVAVHVTGFVLSLGCVAMRTVGRCYVGGVRRGLWQGCCGWRLAAWLCVGGVLRLRVLWQGWMLRLCVRLLCSCSDASSAHQMLERRRAGCACRLLCCLRFASAAAALRLQRACPIPARVMPSGL